MRRNRKKKIGAKYVEVSPTKFYLKLEKIEILHAYLQKGIEGIQDDSEINLCMNII